MPSLALVNGEQTIHLRLPLELILFVVINEECKGKYICVSIVYIHNVSKGHESAIDHSDMDIHACLAIKITLRCKEVRQFLAIKLNTIETGC